ncbi:MAG: hypothetical protein WCV80_03140 [Candidatus Paceibacterota bacterium]|jgi:hypothetical protein
MSKQKTESLTKLGLTKLLESHAKDYRKDTIARLKRNRHMHDLSRKDIRELKKNPELFERVVDAILVGFINEVAAGQGMDLGLYTHYLRKK